MKKISRFFVLALLLSLGVAAAHLDPKDETDAEVNAALEVFDAGQQPHTIQITHRDTVTSPWTARIYLVREKDFVTWEETGYPRLMLAVLAVQHDQAAYPAGHVGEYKE